MGFAGHVFDMMRRDKQNREMMKSLRERTKNARNINSKTESSAYMNLTVEEMDKIKEATRERELSEQRYTVRMTFRVIGIAVVVLILLGAVFYFFIL